MGEVTGTVMKDERKILFFSCVNDEGLYAQCVRHIRQLKVPEGFRVEIGHVQGASGMAQGYNMAMARSDAKYKVYLHQDALIVNRDFLYDIIRLFTAHPEVGLLGVAGCETLPSNGVWWEGKRLLGKLIECRTTYNILKFADPTPPFSRVQAVDGLIMATQYDLPWREDLFSGFHFYDTSQSLEFIKAGRQVAVPAQADPWCLHLCGETYVNGDYMQFKEIFLQNYGVFCI